jgi:hypothetical protein
MKNKLLWSVMSAVLVLVLLVGLVVERQVRPQRQQVLRPQRQQVLHLLVQQPRPTLQPLVHQPPLW